MQQQHLDQGAGARRVAVGLAGGGPERVVLGGEHLGRAGLRQRGRPGQRAGLAEQDLQIVVQIKDFGALADRALMAGHHRGAVIDGDRRGRQLHPQPMADEPGRHRVLVAAHHHLRVAVHPRGQRQRGVERLAGQRPQQRLLERPVLAHAGGPVADPAGVISVIGGFQQGVEFIDGVHHRHRHAVVAAKPPALALDAALLVAALMSGLAVPGLKSVVASETRSSGRSPAGSARTAPV